MASIRYDTMRYSGLRRVVVAAVRAAPLEPTNNIRLRSASSYDQSRQRTSYLVELCTHTFLGYMIHQARRTSRRADRAIMPCYNPLLSALVQNTNSPIDFHIAIQLLHLLRVQAIVLSLLDLGLFSLVPRFLPHAQSMARLFTVSISAQYTVRMTTVQRQLWNRAYLSTLMWDVIACPLTSRP